jgi:hypothetical protein
MNIRTIIAMTACMAVSAAHATPKGMTIIAHTDKNLSNSVLRVVIRDGKIVRRQYLSTAENAATQMLLAIAKEKNKENIQ